MGLTTRIGDCAGGHIALTHYEPGEICRAHRHRGAQISLLLSGDYHEDGSAGRVAARDGALTGKPAGFEHENLFGDFGALILSINLEDAPFLKTYVAGDPLVDMRERLIATAVSGDLSRLMPSGRPPSGGAREAGCARPWLDQAHAALRTGEETRSDGLARAAGVHPVTFARMFRSAFGEAPGRVRTSLRTARAVQDVVRSDARLIEVALDAGFADQAHMTRSIRQATGYPPARLRRMFATG